MAVAAAPPAGGAAVIEQKSRPAQAEAISAPNSDHWAFRAVRRPVIPPVNRQGWAQTPIDAFILARLEARQLSPAPFADRRTLIRRASYDLIGLPPTPEEIDIFVQDRSPDAFAKVVDRLLASPAYGERWGRHWLDVVRYADARDLIQLPVESDFREAWRYRDWVIEAHNRDLPYAEFIRRQIAGDLLQPGDPETIDTDALIATGFLAIADFVPGDVDKELMIADYVNDQIDVVGRSFLGLTLGCARCHDHKFDPITIQDYYSLAGIFFSTRLIPSPVLGNTPLIRVPLLPRAELARIEVRRKRVADLETQIRKLKLESELEYLTNLERLVTEQTAGYLQAIWRFQNQAPRPTPIDVTEFAKLNQLHPKILSQWLDYFGLRKVPRVGSLPEAGDMGEPKGEFAVGNEVWAPWRQALDKADGNLREPSIAEGVAREIENALAMVRRRRATETDMSTPAEPAQPPAPFLKLQATDTPWLTPGDGRVNFWPNRGRAMARFATVASTSTGPLRTNVAIAGRSRPVLRFAGNELLEFPTTVPPAGSLFLVFHPADATASGQRVIGWEDSDGGRHGLGLMLTPGGGLHAIVRKDGANGDIVAPSGTNRQFEIVSLTWGNQGAALYRQGVAVGKSSGLEGISSDAEIKALRLGGPGSGGAGKFRGDLAEIRVYAQPLEDATRAKVEQELFDVWLNPDGLKESPPSPIARLYDELCSARGPFWLVDGERDGLISSTLTSHLNQIRVEHEALLGAIPTNVPQAVVVQEGGPASTKHEGFRDTHILIRGNPAHPGKIVPRGFPRFLAGDRQPPITEGSGRLRLAEWIASTNHPLTARVAVNRIWQHHFGQGIVRTSTNFGQRGERPTHQELLDFLAHRFIESGGSMKAIHRIIMLSGAYQQRCDPPPETLASDPENLLLGRMNRMSLDAESLRDSLLVVAGRLDRCRGGVAYQELALPRRTLYLMSVRTGAKSGFASVFDGPDCTAVVEKRSATTVAPQALFLLNDPFTIEQARVLARRVVDECASSRPEDQIRTAYRLALGRHPMDEEIAVGRALLRGADQAGWLERFCQLLFCANEFFYID